MSTTTNPPINTRSWLRVLFLSLFVIGAAMLLAGFIYEKISEARDRGLHPMPGKLIDVGGYKMHLNCKGQGTTPTVILDSGLGNSFAVWHKVQASISKFARVCSYDRAGVGYSDTGPQPRTSKDIAEELHTLLSRAGVPEPLILVGHSMGGLNVRVYTSLYRQDVVGMVLVDASHPQQQQRFPAALNDLDKSWLRELQFMEFTMPFGIPRLLGFCGDDAIIRAAECNFHSARETVAELKSFPVSAAQTAATGSLGDMPLAVLSHDPDGPPDLDMPPDLVKPINDAFDQMQEELAHLSTRGTRIIAKNSSHYIQGDRPDVVVDAVRKILHEARQR